jgi:hypothetical protein
MAAPMPQMLTANRLKDGDVLYWKNGAWVESLKDGDVFAEATPADAALAAAQAYVGDNIVVNPYLFDVRVDASGIHPVKEREIIRAAGPSVRDDLGKQADPLTSPLRGGRKTLSTAKSFSGGGDTSSGKPPPEALRASTSPQGGGETDPASEDGHVSI